MVRRSSNRPRVPFLHDHQIEEEANLLIAEWEQAQEVIVAPPVPIEEILECHLRLSCEVADLRNELGHADVLGGIWFGKRLIKFDRTLDPALNLSMLGRYRFTLAHEVGHWRLHRQHLMNDPAAAPLFEHDCDAAFVNRSSANPPEEIQANAFAANVLMPRRMIREAWQRWRCTEEPVALASLAIRELYADRRANEEMAMEEFCKPLAKMFEVSAQAMRYRLQALGLLVARIEPGLFG